MGFVEWLTLGGGDLVLSIANLVLVLIALTFIFATSYRIKGATGRKILDMAFVVLAIKILLEVLNELGIVRIGSSDLYTKLAETIFLILAIIYFKGVRIVIDNMDRDRIAKLKIAKKAAKKK